MDKPEFAIECDGMFPINKCYGFPYKDYALTALLNSGCLWFCFRTISVPKRGGFREATAQHIAPLPYPNFTPANLTHLAELGEHCTVRATTRFNVHSAVSHRILADLAPPEHANLSRKLEKWWTLDFVAFREEVKKTFRSDIPVKERGDWEAYLAEKGAEVSRLTDEIATAEREIDTVVYDLFDLTPDEITLLESSLAGQY
jgi:hypothetical protein